jgi:hypothetical protein
MGSVALVLFLVEAVDRGYALVVPEALLGVLFFLIFARKMGPAATVTKLVESFGVILVVWLLVIGWGQVFADWGRFLSYVEVTYGRLAGMAAFLVVASFCVLMHLLSARQRERESAKRSEWMQQVTYRKIEEEKWQLERRLRDIEDRQKYFEQHGK